MSTTHNYSKSPKVSIGLPVYNREKFIGQTLESILAQKFTDFELVISDNASTDGTGAICRQYAEKDSRIRYIRQPENLGLVRNFHVVRDEAQGEYFMWTASDDLCDPDFISETVAYLDEHTDVVLVMPDVKIVSEDEAVIKTIKFDSIRKENGGSGWKDKRLLFFRYPDYGLYECVYGLYRTTVVKKCSYPVWDRCIPSIEVPFLAQVAVKGEIASLNLPLKTYRSHSDSVTLKESNKVPLACKFKRGLEIRGRLINTILSSDLDVKEKASLVWMTLHSSVGSMRTFARIIYEKMATDKPMQAG